MSEIEQLALVDAPAKPLTPRQQLALDYLRNHDGVPADEIGAWLHAHRDRRPHPVGERCDYCQRDGRSVLTSKALKPLVTYRRTRDGHLYIARDRGDRPTAAPAERVSASVPDDPFAGL